ncbi:site-specific integrase [uncultured Enterococcus sp.]|uniref:tyrosine-type recombinase/integrase n=1 Tax=uncultured Enterococcus sp. TaxID=167972 RepID=UPI002AA93DE3|nr:site-specific integrase [uncultured Enterococcus sp.]
MWIEKQANGKFKYYERYIDPYTEKSKTVTITLTSASNQAKKQAYEKLQDKIGVAISHSDSSTVTLKELLHQWWDHHRLTVRNSSVRIYSNILKYIHENIEEDALIRNTDVKFFQKFINSLPQSYAYKKKFNSVLKMAFDYAVDMEMLKTNPLNKVSIPKPPLTNKTYETIDKKFLEKDEVRLLLDMLYSSFQSVHVARLAEFMYLTGVRIGEATSITKDDVDIKNRTLKITGTLDYSKGYDNAKKDLPKTLASYRELGLSKRSIEILNELIIENQIKYPGAEFLFVGKTGKPIQISSFNASLQRANEKLGTGKINKSISSHIFRHSHISLLAELGIEPKTIMERVGHSDIETTMKIYTHVTKQSKNNIITKLDEINF